MALTVREDPGPGRSGDKRYDWDGIALELRSRPYEWRKIFDWDRASLATCIRNDDIKVLPAADFEVATRNNYRGYPRMCTLYMRFNPGFWPEKRRR